MSGERSACAVRAPRVGVLFVVACLLTGSAAACATWRPLAPAEWQRADSTHADVFRTRLRVTRRDGRQSYLEHPTWTARELRGVYPEGWPRTSGEDTLIVVPRDSIAEVARLESNRGRTAVYLMAVIAGAAVAAARQ